MTKLFYRRLEDVFSIVVMILTASLVVSELYRFNKKRPLYPAAEVSLAAGRFLLLASNCGRSY